MPDDSIILNGRTYSSARDAGKQFGYTRDYVLMLARDGKIDATKVGSRWYIFVPSFENFLTQSEKSKILRNEELRKKRKKELVRTHSDDSRFMLFYAYASLSGLSIFLFVCAYVFYGDQVRSSDVHSAQVIESTQQVRSEISQEENAVQQNGIVVFETHNTSEEEIADHFSDPVTVIPSDADGVDGVIIPHFKDGASKDTYRYVMVPVVETEEKNEQIVP